MITNGLYKSFGGVNGYAPRPDGSYPEGDRENPAARHPDLPFILSLFNAIGD